MSFIAKYGAGSFVYFQMLFFFSYSGASELGEFHAFIVIDMLNLSEVSGKEIFLLRIRNPWGRRCWRGPWCEG